MRPAARFNEAAAYHCGKLRLGAARERDRAASMRPQHITAENTFTTSAPDATGALQ